jgi:hypothetical protein
LTGEKWEITPTGNPICPTHSSSALMFMAICTALELKGNSMMAFAKKTKILPAQIFFAGQNAIKHFTLPGFS